MNEVINILFFDQNEGWVEDTLIMPESEKSANKNFHNDQSDNTSTVNTPVG
jgi:hypothetical protein